MADAPKTDSSKAAKTPKAQASKGGASKADASKGEASKGEASKGDASNGNASKEEPPTDEPPEGESVDDTSSPVEADEDTTTQAEAGDPSEDDDSSEAEEDHSLYKFLEKWQSTCLLEHQLTFTEAVESLSPKSKKRLIEARAGTGKRSSTWTVRHLSVWAPSSRARRHHPSPNDCTSKQLFDTRTNQEAVLVHTAIWRSNTSFDTGNFAPEGQKPPIHVSNQRVQRAPGFKCEITYTIDTTTEDSFYTNLQILEEYIQTVKGFNRENKERSPWQDGTHRDTYNLTSKLFVLTSLNPKEPTFQPHQWLVDVVKGQKKAEYAINPRRPSYFDMVDKKAIKLEKSKPPRYCCGDIIWFSFKVSFYVGNQYWSSDLTPIEFVRVARGIKFGLNNAEDDDDDEEGNKKRSLEEGSAISIIERNPFEDHSTQKRKHHETTDDKPKSSDGSETADDENSANSESTDVTIKEEAEVSKAALPPSSENAKSDANDPQPPPRKKGKKSRN
ncbi:hypothetical protein CVT26_003809 [Gymnopilus dilepis]|uniref:Uncharacterized protein n=1 Tax=Gymnopilus dilepis TaxID=231916 RepID=A0A409YM71_9AGAR|nr:hypothetical protein CVT26_003809 [Gymnopilus dilepis]